MPLPTADWQLPPGVSRGVWDHARDGEAARRYDDGLADCPLLTVDVAFAERHFGRPGRLLDVGCGTGRLLVPLARRGFQVCGVDLSAGMLRVAAERAAATGVRVDLMQANVVELGCIDDATFDCAACLFSTLGLISGAEERRRAVAHVYRVLRPGGVFVLHVHNVGFNFWAPAGRRWLWRDVARRLLRRPGVGDRDMPAHDGLPPMPMHLFTRREATGLLQSCGFRIAEVMPVSLRADGRLRCPWWFGGLRAYGYLIAAVRPREAS